MYFSDLTGNWNTGPNNYWGEIVRDSADRFPEVFVGRITAYYPAEVSNWRIKTLHYEKTPGVIFDSVLWVYAGCFGIGDVPSAFPPHFGHIEAEDNDADVALQKIDRGYGLINVNCHGEICNFELREWDSNPYIYSWRSDSAGPLSAGLNWLTNVNKYFVGYSPSCDCGAFDSLAHTQEYPYGSDTCIEDAFVDAYLYNHQGSQGPYGACAYLTNTRLGWLYKSHDLQYEFYMQLFATMHIIPPIEPYASRIGVAEALSKCGGRINWNAHYYPPDPLPDEIDRYVCYTNNLFGSPYTEVWTRTPKNLTVSHPNHIYVGVPTNFTVTVKEAITQTPVQYAKVCLNKPGDIYQVGPTNANGRVTFNITAQSTGTLKVTVTRCHNLNNYTQYRPSQTTCEVIRPPGGGQATGTEEILPAILCITGLPALVRDYLAVSYGVPLQGDALLTIYDVTGSKVKTVRISLRPGFYSKNIETKDLPSGIYFIVLKQNNEQVSKKFLLIR